MASGDESMLRDPRHPAHTSGGREAIAAAAAAAGLIVVFWVLVPVPWLGLFWKVFVTLAVAIPAGLVVERWIGGGAARHSDRIEADRRAAREEETRRQLSEMRAREGRD